jgi:hypothetical protein
MKNRPNRGVRLRNGKGIEGEKLSVSEGGEFKVLVFAAVQDG